MSPSLHRIARFAANLSLALCAASLLSACDPHRAERQQVQALHSQQQADLAHQQRLAEQAAAEVAQTERTLAEQQSRRADLNQAQAQLAARLTEYLSQHKAAAVALAATGTGALTALDDDTRQTLQRQLGDSGPGMAMLAGIAGAGYCIFNAEECTAVGSYFAAYGMERKANQERMAQADAQLQQLAQARDTQQQALLGLQAKAQALQADMQQTEQRLTALACKGIFCGK